MNTHTNDLMTLTGYLGKDRTIRYTEERTYERRTPPTELRFELAGTTETELLWEPWDSPSSTYEVTTSPREYAVLSLATHQRKAGKWETTWHRIYAWNLERNEFRNVRMCRKGDRVRITCRTKTIKTDGRPDFTHLELVELETLKVKAPEIA